MWEYNITAVIHVNTKHNRQTQIHRRLSCSGTNALINFWLHFFDTRRETILKGLSYHTMLITSLNGRNPTLYPNGRNSTIVFPGLTSKYQLHGRTPTSKHYCRTQLLTIMVGTQLQLSAIDADNPTVYLHGPMSTPNWLFFKIFKFSGPSLPGMTSSTLQHHFLSGVYYDNCDCRILCARVYTVPNAMHLN